MAALTTLAIGALALGAVSTGYSIYAGEEQRRSQKDALGRQRQVAKQAEASALRQQQQADEEARRASAMSPIPNDLLGDAQSDALLGTGSTMLTGPRGLDPNRLRTSRGLLGAGV